MVVVQFPKRHVRASADDAKRSAGMCILASASYVTPGTPRCAARLTSKSNSSTGQTPVRLRSPTVEALMPSSRPTTAGPPSAAMSAATESGAETVAGVATESTMDNLYRISVGAVNRISVDNACDPPDMGDSNDRLRQARKRAGFPSATAAAQRFGWTVTTYLSHENGQTAVPANEAPKYAKAFKASAGWLLTGEGPMDAQNLTRLMGRIGAGAEIRPEFEQIPDDGLEEIELPFPIGLDTIAFEVEGDSMLPRYDHGALIVCSNGPRNPDDFIGVEVAVRTAKGQRYLKTLRHGSRKGLYDLESFNARLIPDVKIAWIGEILATIPAHRRPPSAAPRKRAIG